MAKEIERAGIPVALISALYSLALTTGASRVVRGTRIEHVCGNPRLSPEKDRELGMRIIMTALRSLQTEVSGPTLFDPEAESLAPSPAGGGQPSASSPSRRGSE